MGEKAKTLTWITINPIYPSRSLTISLPQGFGLYHAGRKPNNPFEANRSADLHPVLHRV